ncbi:MAG: right-handed parallel beta-helix repeat-containing protein [Planctomycetota bacterium]|jgi:hypothetical protein
MKRLLMICAAAAFMTALGNTVQAESWHIPDDFLTIQEAIDSPEVAEGDTIIVAPGNHAGALVDKSVEIKGEDGAVINDGPMHPAGLSMGFRLLAGSDGATISHLGFTVDLAIMNGDAVDYITVRNCTFTNTIQAVSNWRGSGWQISHNVITDLRTRSGGGIGIIIADYSGGVVESNVVSHNKISGTLHVDPADGGGYAGSGIVLYADFRWTRTGAEAIKNNAVIKNKVSLVSDTPEVVDVWAFELTDTRDDPGLGPVLFDNSIGFNDFRETTNHIALTPSELDEANDISRNLGDNRGHGLHPSVFGAGID